MDGREVEITARRIIDLVEPDASRLGFSDNQIVDRTDTGRRNNELETLEITGLIGPNKQSGRIGHWLQDLSGDYRDVGSGGVQQGNLATGDATGPKDEDALAREIKGEEIGRAHV